MYHKFILTGKSSLLDVMKNIIYIEKCPGFDTYIHAFIKTGISSYLYNERNRVLL